MRQLWHKYIYYGVVLVLLQVLVFNQMTFHIGKYTYTPYPYLLFFMLLPFEIKHNHLVILTFFMGLLIDLLSGTLALHAAASVLVGFLRPYVLTWIMPRLGYSAGTLPSYVFYGFGWFLKYTILMVVIHHFWFFALSVFSFRLFHLTLLFTLITSIYTTITIILLHLIFQNRPPVA